MSSAVRPRFGFPAGEAGVAPRLVLVYVVLAVGALAYLTLRPQQEWMIWGLSILAVAMTDGIVRVHPAWRRQARTASLPYLVLPLFSVLGAGLLFNEGFHGFARIGAALVVAGVGTLAIVGEYQTVAFATRWYGTMRTMLAVLTYLAAFALFAVISDSNLSLLVEAALVGLVSLGLGVELMRESHLVDASTPLVALAIGITLAELRMGLYFFPLDDVLMAALLVIGFYLATGMVHHLLDRDLSVTVAAEYLVVTAAGIAAVVVGRSAS